MWGCQHTTICQPCDVLDPQATHTTHAQVSGGDCPHLLFYGPPGAGKKTLIISLLRELYGPPVEKVLPSLLADTYVDMQMAKHSQALRSTLWKPRRPFVCMHSVGSCRMARVDVAVTLLPADQGGDQAVAYRAAQPDNRNRADDGAEQLPRGDEPQRRGQPGPAHRPGGHQGMPGCMQAFRVLACMCGCMQASRPCMHVQVRLSRAPCMQNTPPVCTWITDMNSVKSFVS